MTFIKPLECFDTWFIAMFHVLCDYQIDVNILEGIDCQKSNSTVRYEQKK